MTRLLPLVLVFVCACNPNLAWIGEKTYDPMPVDTLFVEDLGVEDSVAILQPTAFSIAHALANPSRQSVAGGYEVKEEILRWVFQAAGGSAGWVPGDPDTHIVFADSLSGPALAAGAVDSVSFGPIGPLDCGLYEQILTLDSDGEVDESDEQDNEERYFFFVPSTQQFNINVVEVEPAIFHAAGPTNTHDFVISAAGAPGWVFGHFSFVATEGSQARTMPAPPATGGPAAQTIQMIVTPREHDLPDLGFAPTVTGKITVISRDGCVVKQETARALVEHE